MWWKSFIVVSEVSSRVAKVAFFPDDSAGDDRPDVTLVDYMLSRVLNLLLAEKAAIMAKLEGKQDTGAVLPYIKTNGSVLFVNPLYGFSETAFEELHSNGLSHASSKHPVLEIDGSKH